MVHRWLQSNLAKVLFGHVRLAAMQNGNRMDIWRADGLSLWTDASLRSLLIWCVRSYLQEPYPISRRAGSLSGASGALHLVGNGIHRVYGYNTTFVYFRMVLGVSISN